MKVPWRTVGRWALIVPALAISCFLAFFFAVADLSMFLEPHLAQVAVRIHRAPDVVLRPFHWLVGLIYIAIAVMPAAFCVGFALRKSWKTRWFWLAVVALLFLGGFYVWNGHRENHVDQYWAAAVAACFLVPGIALHFRFSPSNRLAGRIVLVAYLTLFLPLMVPIFTGHRLPSAPRSLWSVSLQKQPWQGMNTGNHYDATRQMVFAGQRLVVLFNAGTAGYSNNWPISNYRAVSLDLTSGEIVNQIEFNGRWGSLPHLYATDDGRVIVQGEKSQFLNADLTVAASQIGTSRDGEKQAKFNLNCGVPEILNANSILVAGCGSMRLMTPQQEVLAQRADWEHAYWFGGESANGSRFALQSYDERGDPSILLYEMFFIYDTATLQPIAVVPVSDLPERQSWTAFSHDGRYFAVGNPNRITLYELP
jgi:hypothetical protein